MTPTPTTSDAATLLRQTHLFDGLAAADLADLAAGCGVTDVRAGDVLIRQGELGDRLYLVVDGRLEATQRGADGVELLLGDLRPGEPFGEIALLERTPRTATVRATRDGRVLALDRAALDAFLARHPAVRDALVAAIAYRVEWAKTRRRRPPSAQLVQLLSSATGCTEPAALAAVEDECAWVTLPRGAVLMRQGEPGDCLYVIASGRLRVYGVDDAQAEVTIAELGPGETVGEMALLSKEPRTADVAAVQDTELLRLSEVGLERLLDAQPKVMGVFARSVVDRLARRIRARSVVTQLRAAPLVTPAECEAVTRTENLVLRNLRITQMYHRLSLEIALLIGQQDANWCTFACNASKTAGYSIRREELPYYELLLLARRSRRGARAVESVEAGLRRLGLLDRADAILDAVSATISAGNLKVYAELAPVFSAFVIEFHRDASYDRARLERFVGRLKPGPTDQGGQALLGEALGHYYEAAFEPMPKRKAELILLGNAKVGLHEQTRLQPNIVEALDVPLALGLDGVLSTALLGPVRWALPRPAAAAATAVLRGRERALARRAAATWRRLVTRSMMTLRLPYGEVRLGRDVPRLPSARLFPDVLQELELRELVALVHRFDRAPDTLGGSAASDWGNLDDRMGFIVDLFRSRQKSLELFDEPFLYEQRLDLVAGVVPAGRL